MRIAHNFDGMRVRKIEENENKKKLMNEEERKN
jgi:hypothetical protein